MSPAPPDTFLVAYSLHVAQMWPAFVAFMLWIGLFAGLLWRYRHDLPPTPKWRGW